MALTVLAAYDVSDDNRRSHLAALLQAWGDRLQRSVFLLTLTDDDLAALTTRATGILDLAADSLYLVRLCQDCWGDTVAIGQADYQPPPLAWTVL